MSPKRDYNHRHHCHHCQYFLKNLNDDDHCHCHQSSHHCHHQNFHEIIFQAICLLNLNDDDHQILSAISHLLENQALVRDEHLFVRSLNHLWFVHGHQILRDTLSFVYGQYISFVHGLRHHGLWSWSLGQGHHDLIIILSPRSHCGARSPCMPMDLPREVFFCLNSVCFYLSYFS